VAMNLQTSFLTPPFGFALFYLRSVAAKSDYKDRVTGAAIPAVTTAQIYKGSIAFIVLQLVMVAAIVAYPSMVISGIDKVELIDADKALNEMVLPERETPSAEPAVPAAAEAASASGGEAPDSAPAKEEDEDPMKAIMDAVKKDAAGSKKP
jgi:Tripartite ATP-independent periplasmic transporter, DctM component